MPCHTPVRSCHHTTAPCSQPQHPAVTQRHHSTTAFIADPAAYARTGRTTIIVAHRLTTVRRADCIVVLGKGGAILEQGTHHQLKSARGAYYRMLRAKGRAVGVTPLSDEEGAAAVGALTDSDAPISDIVRDHSFS